MKDSTSLGRMEALVSRMEAVVGRLEGLSLVGSAQPAVSSAPQTKEEKEQEELLIKELIRRWAAGDIAPMPPID